MRYHKFSQQKLRWNYSIFCRCIALKIKPYPLKLKGDLGLWKTSMVKLFLDNYLTFFSKKNYHWCLAASFKFVLTLKCLMSNESTAWKASKYGVFFSPYLSVFSPNAGKYGLGKTPYLDTFHAAKIIHTLTNLQLRLCSSMCDLLVDTRH